MIRTLPTFKGWTVDTRLKEFRLVGCVSFLDNSTMYFDSDEGDALLTEYIKTLEPNSVEFNEIAEAIC